MTTGRINLRAASCIDLCAVATPTSPRLCERYGRIRGLRLGYSLDAARPDSSGLREAVVSNAPRARSSVFDTISTRALARPLAGAGVRTKALYVPTRIRSALRRGASRGPRGARVGGHRDFTIFRVRPPASLREGRGGFSFRAVPSGCRLLLRNGYGARPDVPPCL